MTAKLLEFPKIDTGINDIPQALRDMADAIERGEHGDAHNLAWVIDAGNGDIRVGLFGKTASAGADAYYLLGLGKRRIEDR